ncbi:hypothetical protein [Nakamurella aerolata]|uniref:Uncharacterized protein n=1 Tax=Nakamurella aerolata TaxID=1656892 RepID=A0A849AE44_9ACTN|nr:hypothetical protein [Nakamurella aerolata]NNG37458.1 hypothetical protein [Nakamurella aerolata]
MKRDEEPQVRFHVQITRRDQYLVTVPQEMAIEDGIGSIVYDKILEGLYEDERPGINKVLVEEIGGVAVVQLISSTEPGIGEYPDHRDPNFDNELLAGLSPDLKNPVIYTIT